MKTTTSCSRTTASDSLFAKAQALLPGGVNSPVRAYKAVGGTPRFIARAEGARVWDEDGHELLDYVGAWGPMILGHRHPAVIKAIERQLASGLAFGAPTALEVEMAATVTRADAVDRDGAVRQLGNRSDDGRAAAGARRHEPATRHQVRGLLSRSRRQLPGEGRIGRRDVWHARQSWRDDRDRARHVDGRVQRRRERRRAARRYPGEVAAIIVEPVVGNMGVVAPSPTFLAELRGWRRHMARS